MKSFRELGVKAILGRVYHHQFETRSAKIIRDMLEGFNNGDDDDEKGNKSWSSKLVQVPLLPTVLEVEQAIGPLRARRMQEDRRGDVGKRRLQ